MGMSRLYGHGFTADIEFEERRMNRLRPELDPAYQEQRQSEDEALEARRHAEHDAALAAYRDKPRV